jgi:ATP citrate (pro-S)-lyase
MREAGEVLGITIQVYGPETHMTAIVGMGMGLKPVEAMPLGEASFIDSLLTTSSGTASPRNAAGYSYGKLGDTIEPARIPCHYHLQSLCRACLFFV